MGVEVKYTKIDASQLTLDEIQEIGSSIVNKSFREIYDSKEISTKGGFGHFIEKYVFNFDPNNDSRPDFITAKAELKVTPVRKNKNGTYSAKERLVLNVINYENEVHSSFYTSSFWQKNATLYILFYLYSPSVNKLDYLILKEHLLEFEKLKKDLLIIKRDWEIIHNKIRDGKAHEISEADTMYLGACTKGVNSKSLRNQPNSHILAKQRAYSLKQSYMTQVFNRVPLDESINLMVDGVELEKLGFESLLENKLMRFIGKSQNELKTMLNVTSTSKNINELLISAMLGLKNTKISKTDEFMKANIIPKTIRLEDNGTIREHMSFKPFDFINLVEQSWDDSDLKNYFETTKFMFALFQKSGSQYYFKGVKFWNMPIYDIENDLKEVWERTVNVLKKGMIVSKITHVTENFFPKATQNRVAHVRPHAKDSKDEYPLPVPDIHTKKTSFTKQGFWLNKEYVLEVLKTLFVNKDN